MQPPSRVYIEYIAHKAVVAVLAVAVLPVAVLAVAVHIPASLLEPCMQAGQAPCNGMPDVNA